MKGKKLTYALIGLQFIAWGWYQWQGGQLSAQHYYIFCIGMLCGQVGAGIECWRNKSWGTFLAQCYFSVWTVIGGIQCYLQT
jgi:hypothetical protein